MESILVQVNALFLFMLVQVQAQPYNSSIDDQIASSSSFCLIVIFLCSYAFKNAALVDLEEIQLKMSHEQHDLYVFDSAILSAILIGALVGTLLVSGVIFVIILRIERVRRRNEARAARARRLRSLNDDQEVLLRRLPALTELVHNAYPKRASPSPRSGPFHLFLSHDGQHGQSVMRVINRQLLEMLPDVEVFLDGACCSDVHHAG